ncbi:hypothetical protein [Niabella beijingensis]|uniref:hypothetical protein n=1 Tax=Niabella beijingensis TaxID=2872700 RepID=UPI001CBF37FC|nr:hypothetical protein [Niabella beijingensis]MBZ4192537.1 hypothetical protein [Niabella beijingensis]
MPHSSKTALTVLLENVEMTASNICFTGDAIAMLENYTVKGAVLNLDDWHWHAEQRGGLTFYIITSLKQADS